MAGLHGRRVLVTGASSGIGHATARAVASAGAAVACLARRSERVRALAREVGGVAVPADVTDPGATRAAVDRAARELGGLDGVVNNAGVMLLGTVADGDPSEWRRMLDVNVFGLLTVTQAALPHLRTAGGGDVVNVSSLAGRRVSAPFAGVYSGTKHAVHAISEGLRQELHGDGIRVIVISPGVVRTELGAHMGDEPLRERTASTQDTIGLSPDDVGRQIAGAMAQPPAVTLQEIALLPTAQD